MKKFLLQLLSLYFGVSYAQNCDYYKSTGNKKKAEACKKYVQAKKQYQFLAEHHKLLDQVIAIDSTYSDAYWSKSIAYLKSGDFLSWKPLIDKAVALDPKMHLGYRGWCRYQFFKDYKGAIKDIEDFEKLIQGDVGYCQNGDYHLLIAKALCYKAIGNPNKAIQIIENYLNTFNNEPDLYNYYHLGVLYFELEKYGKALRCFLAQKKANNFAENQYYLALCYKELKVYLVEMKKAKQMYEQGYIMLDSYTHHLDKIYLRDIEKALK